METIVRIRANSTKDEEKNNGEESAGLFFIKANRQMIRKNFFFEARMDLFMTIAFYFLKFGPLYRGTFT